MKTGLLMSVVMVGGIVGGATEVWAACTTTPNCESLGYQYCASECPNGSVVCPFDSNKHFCFNPVAFTVTAETCKAECKNIGTKSCTKNGTTYYESCGASTCKSEQICSSGTCKNPVATSGWCCGYSGCSMDEDWCQRNYSKNCYRVCTEDYGYPDCTDMQASCRASGGTPRFQRCPYVANGIDYVAEFGCQ